MKRMRHKPGMMLRAMTAWTFLNVAMVAVLSMITYFLHDYMDRWYVALPIVVGILVSELVICSETLAGAIRDWVRQMEVVDEPEETKQANK